MFGHWMLPDEPLRLQKLGGAIIALGGVTLIWARRFGFNAPLAFWRGVAVVVETASAAFGNVLVKARSMQLAPAMLAAWQMIFRNCAIVIAWPRRQWKPSALSLDCHNDLLSTAITSISALGMCLSHRGCI